HVILGEGVSSITHTTAFPSNFTFYKIPYRPAERVFSLNDQAAFLKDVERQATPDCVLTTSGPAYWRPKAPHVMGFNLAHYLYPDSAFYDIISKKSKIKWRLKGRVIKHYFKNDADAYVVQTNDVNERLRSWLGTDKVYTVTNTYGSQYDIEPTGEKKFLPQNTNNEFRLLMLSSYYPHKNFEIIDKIMSLLEPSEKEKVKFVLTLPDDSFNNLFSEENRKYIYNVGPVKPKDCPQLYSECEAVFLPTLLECFSATYAEAMRMKLPIVTTDLGFAHTVCGEAALYFTPLDAADAKNKILLLWRDANLRKELVEAGQKEMEKFNSSRQRAVRFLEITQDLINRK
ncbi:MAG: glycosyltransferase family 1 protein, partial [Sphingobacteriales bacterium]